MSSTITTFRASTYTRRLRVWLVGAVHGLAVLVNSVIHNRRFWPAPDGTPSQGECDFRYNYSAGDQISLAVWSEDSITLQSGSFHIMAELLSV